MKTLVYFRIQMNPRKDKKLFSLWITDCEYLYLNSEDPKIVGEYMKDIIKRGDFVKR